jgi:hypothetical protein
MVLAVVVVTVPQYEPKVGERKGRRKIRIENDPVVPVDSDESYAA